MRAVWDVRVLTKNRDRLLRGAVWLVGRLASNIASFRQRLTLFFQ
jgi:hypothetical protein